MLKVKNKERWQKRLQCLWLCSYLFRLILSLSMKWSTMKAITGPFYFIFNVFIASHESSPRREEVPLSRVWLQVQMGDSAEIPHDQAHRYQRWLFSPLKMQLKSCCWKMRRYIYLPYSSGRYDGYKLNTKHKLTVHMLI